MTEGNLHQLILARTLDAGSVTVQMSRTTPESLLFTEPATGSDIPSTGSDVLSTGSDIPSTGSDVLSTGSDIPSTGSDVLSTGSEYGECEVWLLYDIQNNQAWICQAQFRRTITNNELLNQQPLRETVQTTLENFWQIVQGSTHETDEFLLECEVILTPPTYDQVMQSEGSFLSEIYKNEP